MAMTYDQFKGQRHLPKFAIPKRYIINLKPNLISCNFSGVVSIEIDVVSSTKFLVLNAVDLDIDIQSILFNLVAFSKELRPVRVELIDEDEILVAEFAEELPMGVGVLSISYEGILNDQMKGFYRSVYKVNGETKNMAVTQFEPVDARRCFPCWDEPAAKATFKISLDVPSELIALSNMPVVEEKEHGDLKTVHFEESPVMSTYLVAIVVGLFDYTESYTSDGIKVRCYCQIGKTDQGKFALDVALKTLEIFKKYFDSPYVLPKLDMIAIPNFSGAMENYGLVTFSETDLLYDEQNSAATDKRWITEVVGHELAHQWFGNLVTMEWWTHLWLNEGFATWVSYLAVDALFPEWGIWVNFLVRTSNGLRLDALTESHPIEVEINHAHEIAEIFDAISYSKGASLVRMLQGYVGADCFQRALASYIKRYAFSNAKTEDLWAVLEEESGEPIKDLMSSWTKQKGYPVVSVKLNNHTLEIDQSHFLLSGNPGNSMWIVPITLCCGSYDTQQTFLLRSKSGTIEVKGSEWIKVNVEQKGFYRVKYDEKLTAKLQSAIESNVLSATDRFGILDDAYALCMGGHLSLTSLLTLIVSFREETNYTVLAKLIDISYQVLRINGDASPVMVNAVKKLFISLFQNHVGTLGWDSRPGESHLDSMLRGELLVLLAKLGHGGTLDEAIKRFNAFLDDRNSSLLPPDIRKAVYVAVMQKVTVSDKSGYEALLRIYRETDFSQEKERIIGSLGSCPDPDIVLEILNFLLSSEVRNQDVLVGLKICIEGRETAWKWLKDNWDHISNAWGSGFYIGSFVKAVVSPEFRPVRVELIAEDEILVAEFAVELPKGFGVLSISFEGKLNDQMKGFYRSTYQINGQMKNMAVTKFKTVDARRCFPCWDEPAAKATFKISLDVPSELVALSNMPVIEEKEHGDLKTVQFEESTVMSTYLVAVVVGLFDYTESYTSDDIRVRCYCQVGKTDQGKFGLDVAVKTLEIYKKYFDSPYVLPKLDMIAIPDLAARGMENYGLVTFRDTDLLYDEQNSAATDKISIAKVVGHEVAHQWFGNLVTMEWWTHLWLNKGFATWVSHLAVDALFPEWKKWFSFLVHTTIGRRLDSLAESHPIEIDINHAHEIAEIFDDISYHKGVSLVHMLQGYVGADCFQRAVALYINRYACSNAKTEDLWAILEEESGEPIKDLMSTWTKLKGYPVVSVKLNDEVLEIDQSHFLLSGNPGNSTWIVPITLCCGSYDARQTFLLQSKSGTIEVKGSEWIKVNVEQQGFYRVKYDEKLATKLQYAIESNLLSITDRFGILDDAYALCMGGHQSLTSLLTLMGSFKRDPSYIVLAKLINISYNVLRIVGDAAPEMVNAVKKFFISLFQRYAGNLGWEPRPGENHLGSKSRIELLILLAKLGHDGTLDEAIKRFNAFLADRNSSLLPPDMRKAAYVAVMQKASVSNKSTYEALLRIYKEPDLLSQEKEHIIGALGSCPDLGIVFETLDFLSSSEFRIQDFFARVKLCVGRRETAWKWLKDNWDLMSKVWGPGFDLGTFVKAAVSKFSSLEMVKEVEEFFASRTKPRSIARIIKQSIENIQINSRWVHSIRNEERLREAIEELTVSN